MKHSRKGVYVAMPRALKEYANPQALGGLNEHERKTGQGSCEPGELYTGSPASLRYEPVPLQANQGREAERHARNNLKQAQTARLSRNSPPSGVPYLIASNALQSALKRSQREELARVETFMFENYLARLPRQGEYPAFRLDSRTASKLIDDRLSAGYWLKIKEACNHWKDTTEGPALRKLSDIYMLSPEYMKEIARQDMQRARLSRITASRPPMQRKPRPPENMDRNTALWLSEGGINWKPLKLLSMLEDPTDYFPPEEIRTGWQSLHRGWRILAGSTASRPLCPQWEVKGRGWLYASDPNLQGLPHIVRGNVLTVDRLPLDELDITACQLNIANHYGGGGIMPDPLDVLLRDLKGKGIVMLREELKASLYPFFHRRKRKRSGFLQRAQWDIGLTEEQAVTFWTALQPLKTESGRRLMEVQGQILQKALDILAGIEARPVLPLFDAIATAELEKARYAIEEASRLILGEPLPLKIKTARQRSLFTG